MRNIFTLIFLVCSSFASAATYYVAVNGSDSNPGTISSPFATWQKGFTVAKAGDIVYIRGGNYYPAGLSFNGSYSGAYASGKSGTGSSRITIQNYPGEVPILDCKNMNQTGSHFGVRLINCNYWTLKGLIVKNAKQHSTSGGATGINLNTSNYNIIENCEVSYTGGPGITVLYESEGNLLKNCDSHHNYDQRTGGESSDGYIVGEISYRSNPRTNTMIGCRAWDNSDDGFDHYRADGLLIFESCWAWRNGYQPGTNLKAVTGDGNGFKLGEANRDGARSETRSLRQMYNCLAIRNYTRGISQEACNFNVRIFNTLSYGNNQQGFSFPLFNRKDTLINCVSDNNAGDTFQSLQYRVNSFWNSDTKITDADYISVDITQLSRARQSDGSLPEFTAFHLASNSEAVDAGKKVGFSFSGSAPDMGPFEGTGTSTVTPLAYVSSVVETASPSALQITFNKTLANIVPTASSFKVEVNSVARSVNSVSISGSKVLINLSGPVANSNTVTLAYTKPATSILQCSGGSQAPTMSAKSVTNNVGGVPVYVSSLISSSAPTKLEITYSQSLATALPSVSSFSVMVNSVARPVSSVSISGTKVFLSFSSSVAAGNVITVAYTKPGTNPLQSSTSGQVASFTAKTVTNSVGATSGTSMAYLSSTVENATPSKLSISYSLTLSTAFNDYGRFSVKVNSISRTITSLSLSGAKVILSLSSPLRSGDIVTVSYVKPSSNLLQSTTGLVAPTLTIMPVTNYVGISGPTYLSAVVQNPNLVQLTYDAALAPVIPSVSSFNITVDSVHVDVNSVEISGTQVLLTLGTSVESGDSVTLAYTAPAYNPLQYSETGPVGNLQDVLVSNGLSSGTPTDVDNVSIALPEYAGAVIENSAPDMIEVTYNVDLISKVPVASSFIAKVNGVMKPVKNIIISGNKVNLTLQVEVKHGDIVTIAYVKPAYNPLMAVSGASVLTFADKSVINNTESIAAITIYPNPATDFINISNLEPTKESKVLRIFDFAGKLCLEIKLLSEETNRIPVNLKSGIYIVQVVFGPITKYVQKLVIR